MKKPIFQKVFIWLLSSAAAGIGWCQESGKIQFPIAQSYSGQYSVVGNPQAIQYPSAGEALYAALPTVLATNQIGISTDPINNVVLPQREEYKMVQELPESRSQFFGGYVSNQSPVRYHDPNRKRIFASLPDSIHSEASEPLASSASDQAGVDLESRYPQQGASSGLHSTGPSYGPATADDFRQKSRTHGNNGQSIYLRLTEPKHRHSPYSPKKRVYFTKGHYYYRRSPSKRPSFHKFLQPVKHQGVSPNSVPFKLRLAQKTSFPAYKNGNKFGHDARFVGEPAEPVRPLMSDQKTMGSTRGNVPRPIENQEGDSRVQGNALLRYRQESSMQGNPSFDSPFASVPVNEQVGSAAFAPAANPFDFYGIPATASYQSNHLIPEQEPDRQTETVKIPVAILRGVHDLTGTGLWGFGPKRREKKASDGPEKAFFPSKTTSDWIPMAGGISPKGKKSIEGRPRGKRPGDGFFGPTDSSPETVGFGPQETSSGSGHRDRVTTVSESVVPGRMSSGGLKRKGSVTDVHPPSVAADTSDLVVSSVIKFS